MKKLNGQDLINIGAKLFDDYNFTRTQIRVLLNTLVENNCVEENIEIETICDLIVG